MPGRLFLTGDISGLAAPEPPRRNIKPGEQVLVRTSDGYRHMRWGLIPVGRVNARGRPVMETLINARSETVFDKSAFKGVDRAVVPASGWYEWTGETRRKTAWRIAPKEGGLLWFAAITDVWDAPGGLRVPQVATVACEPNADVRDIHHRMGVLLREDDIATWLNGDQADAKRLMRPYPDGLLHVEAAGDVDWSAP